VSCNQSGFLGHVSWFSLSLSVTSVIEHRDRDQMTRRGVQSD
jgi:hypothetical protein